MARTTIRIEADRAGLGKAGAAGQAKAAELHRRHRTHEQRRRKNGRLACRGQRARRAAEE